MAGHCSVSKAISHCVSSAVGLIILRASNALYRELEFFLVRLKRAVPSGVRLVSINVLSNEVYEIDLPLSFFEEDSLIQVFNKFLSCFERSLGELRNSNGIALLNKVEISCIVSYKYFFNVSLSLP